MRKVFLVLIGIVALDMLSFADGEGFNEVKKLEIKVYYNLAYTEILPYEGQLEFLDKSAKKIMPLNKWDVPKAVVSHKLYNGTGTVEVTFTASSMKVGESVDETALTKLAEEILADWVSKIKTLAESKVKIAQENLAKATEYQKKQKAVERSINELKLKITHAQKKMLEVGDEIDKQNELLDEIKSAIKSMRIKIKEAGEAPQLTRFLEKEELRLEKEVTNLDKLKEKEAKFKDKIKKLNTEIDDLPLYNPLSDAYLSELAEKTMILNWKPERITNLGDDNKLLE